MHRVSVNIIHSHVILTISCVGWIFIPSWHSIQNNATIYRSSGTKYHAQHYNVRILVLAFILSQSLVIAHWRWSKPSSV